MKIMLWLSAFVFPSLAFADGFMCRGTTTGLDFKILNHTQASVGTRTPALMVVSSPYVVSDHSTIAIFTSQNRTLEYRGRGIYEGQVDLRYPETGRRGENIAGTKLGELKTILVDIEFSYSHHDSSLANSVAEIPAKIFYVKRTGEILQESSVCKRYRKD